MSKQWFGCQCLGISKLVFYAQSTGTVISGLPEFGIFSIHSYIILTCLYVFAVSEDQHPLFHPDAWAERWPVVSVDSQQPQGQISADGMSPTPDSLLLAVTIAYHLQLGMLPTITCWLTERKKMSGLFSFFFFFFVATWMGSKCYGILLQLLLMQINLAACINDIL